MTEKEIFDRIVTIIQERQGEDFVVTESLSLKDDLDADSVDLMEFILTLEDEFNIEISDEEIDQLQSVGDVIKIIQDKIKIRSSKAFALDFLFGLILFENLFKPRQLYLPPQNSVLSNLRLAS